MICLPLSIDFNADLIICVFTAVALDVVIDSTVGGNKDDAFKFVFSL